MWLHNIGMKLLNATLVASVMLAYGISPAFAVVIEHRHASDADHHHGWFDWLFDCHDHPCDPHHHEPPSEPMEGDEGSHTHVLFPGTVGHATNWSPTTLPVPPGTPPTSRPELGRPCPEAPSFGLLKPPQLS